MKKDSLFSKKTIPERGPLVKVRRKQVKKILNGYCEDDCGEDCGTNQD